jgi:phosphatidylserine decarboxylase
MVYDDKQVILRSRREHVLHQRLIKKLRALKMHGVVFLSRTDIENLNPIGFEQVFDLQRRNHHALILLPSQAYALQHVFGIKTAIPAANAGESLVRPKSAAGAPADVVISKKRALSARIGFKQFSHCNVRCGCHLGQTTCMRDRFQLWARRRRFENYYDHMTFRALGEARWILGIVAVCLLASVALFPAVSLIFAALLLFSLYFFRDPERQPPRDETLAVAPADGLVVEVKETGESQFINQRVKRVTIFLSVFDVHVNRAPIAGEITHSEPMAGRFLDARNPASSEANARRAWAIEGKGVTIVVRQITGAIARRICAWKQVGDVVKRGERFGMIRFGSRTEVDLPLETEILVKPGERVRGGETPIARLSAKQA